MQAARSPKENSMLVCAMRPRRKSGGEKKCTAGPPLALMIWLDWTMWLKLCDATTEGHRLCFASLVSRMVRGVGTGFASFGWFEQSEDRAGVLNGCLICVNVQIREGSAWFCCVGYDKCDRWRFKASCMDSQNCRCRFRCCPNRVCLTPHSIIEFFVSCDLDLEWAAATSSRLHI